MPAKVYRKILKLGDSKVAVLPPDWLRYYGMKAGDRVEVLYNTLVLIKPIGLKVDQDLLRKEIELIFELENHEINRLKEAEDS
ncbi:hypothetical protein ES703_20955 [subsurface metagenome]